MSIPRSIALPLRGNRDSVPRRELAGCRDVIVHGYIGIDLPAVWLDVEQDLPRLAAALDRRGVRSVEPC